MFNVFGALIVGLTFVPGPTGNYIGVQVDGQYEYLIRVDEKTEYVNAQNGLYVRSEPHIDAERLGSLNYASEVDVAGYGANRASQGWSMIEYGDGYGFVCSDYIQEEKIEPAHDIESGRSGRYLGRYMVTAYEWTGSACANGNYPSEGYTVACNSLPLGTHIYIEGVGERVVEDRGGGGSDWIDLYLGDPDACWDWGVKYRDVWAIE